MRVFIFLVISGLLFISLPSCKKNTSDTNLTPNFYFLNGDTSSFLENHVLFASSDTLTYNIIISSSFYLSQAATITIGAADQYRDSFNLNHNTSYAAMPSGSYNFPTSISAAINTIYDTVSIQFYKSLLADGQKYMLPIKINDVSIYSTSPVASIIYLYIDNSQLAGIYVSNGTRTLYNGDAVNNDVVSIDSFTIVKNLVPQSAFTSELDYANLGANGWKYFIGFSVDDGHFFASPNPVIESGVLPGSFSVMAATYDSNTKAMYIKTSYKNLSGDERIVEESLTLQ